VKSVQNSVDEWKCSHLTENKWADCAVFFRHDASQKSSTLPGCVKMPTPFKRGLLPEQAHSVLQGLLMADRYHHLFLGHGMGLGKTTILIAIQFVQHRINLMWIHVEDHPEMHVTKHNIHEQCPSNTYMYSTFGFDCPCSKRNLTHEIAAKWGITVAMVPITMVGIWQSDWRECYGIKEGTILPFEEDDIMQPVFITAHSDARVSAGDNLERYMNVVRADKIIDPEAEEEDLPVKIYMGDPRVCNSRCLVVTTAESFKAKLVERFSHTVKFIEQREQTNRKGQKYMGPVKCQRTWWDLVLNYLIFDEAHYGKYSSSPGIKAMSHDFILTPQNEEIRIIPVSGTLVTGGLQDLTPFIECFLRIGNTDEIWKNDRVLKNWTNVKGILKAADDWRKKIKNNGATEDEAQEHVESFKALFERLCLKFSPGEDFLGAGPCVTLPPHKYREIRCHFKPRWVKVLDQMQAEVTKAWVARDEDKKAQHLQKYGNLQKYEPPVKDGWAVAWYARLLASFPYLLSIQTIHQGLKFTQAEWKKKNQMGKWSEKNDVYSDHIIEIAKSSGKLDQIERLIKYFDRPLIKGSSEKPRMIFSSYYFASSRIVYLVRIALLNCRPSC
jgi:hypothetical protein